VDEIADSLQLACERIDEFERIQGRSAAGVSRDAVHCLQEAVGVGAATRAVLREQIPARLSPPQGAGPILPGEADTNGRSSTWQTRGRRRR
jgi:hypothetical protein